MKKNQKNILIAALIAGGLVLPLIAGKWDEKKKYHYLPDAGSAAKTKKTKLQKLMKAILPAVTPAEIDPAVQNRIVAGRGTRLEIPPNAFVDASGRVYAEKVQIKITEVIDPLDFVAAGVDLTYYTEKNQREMFESAGMFKIDAAGQGGNPLVLASGKKIGVEFPNIQPGGEFFVYRHDADKKWKLHGHNQEVMSQGGLRIGTRRYQIDALNTWWNFDKPKPECACAKGKVQKADGTPAENYYVHSIGINYKGTFSRWAGKGGSFKVNVHKSSQARFMVIDTGGNLGITPLINVTDKTGFDGDEESAKNFCQDIGLITISAVDETILSDKKRLSEFLGLPVSEYKVDYQDRGQAP